jgi:hypothetical protein
MPIHDWARVDADLFHHFHRCWTAAICDVLNGGMIPPPFSALLEGRFPENRAHHLRLRGDRVVIRRRLTEAVCAIEIVSPGDKHGKRAVEALVGQAVQLLRNEVNLLMVDLFPPTIGDPRGLPGAIWDQLGKSFVPATDKWLTLAAYVAVQASESSAPTMFMEPIDQGDTLPDMPAFLGPDTYVPVPLEATYQVAWANCPPSMRELVETGRLADE